MADDDGDVYHMGMDACHVLMDGWMDGWSRDRGGVLELGQADQMGIK